MIQTFWYVYIYGPDVYINFHHLDYIYAKARK